MEGQPSAPATSGTPDSHKEVYNHDAPEVVAASPGLHPAQQQQQQQPYGYYYQQPGYQQPGYPPEKHEYAAVMAPEPLIWGMRKTTFILSVTLVFVVLAGALGGGLGGSMAVSNANTQCQQKLDAQHAATVTVTETIITTGTVGSTIAPTHASTTSRPAASTTSGPLSVPTTGVLALDCPAINQTTQSIFMYPNSVNFNVTCGLDLNGANVDILAIVAYSLEDCMRACASYNIDAGAAGCAAVEFNADLTNAVSNWFGTCWLKKKVDVQAMDSNAANANMHAAAILSQ